MAILAQNTTDESNPVLVTTAHRGVFFGYLEGDAGATLTLARARNCIYWSVATKGFLGLASTGPDTDCRVGPHVESLTLHDVTAVVVVSPDAVTRWEAAPWS